MLMITEVRSDINPAAVVSEGCTQMLQLKHFAQLKKIFTSNVTNKKKNQLILLML